MGGLDISREMLTVGTKETHRFLVSANENLDLRQTVPVKVQVEVEQHRFFFCFDPFDWIIRAHSEIAPTFPQQLSTAGRLPTRLAPTSRGTRRPSFR